MPFIRVHPRSSEPFISALGRDLSLIEIGDTVQVVNGPSTTNPSIAAITNAAYQSKVSAGDTVILWGSNFSIGGNSLFWTQAGTNQNVALSEGGHS